MMDTLETVSRVMAAVLIAFAVIGWYVGMYLAVTAPKRDETSADDATQ